MYPRLVIDTDKIARNVRTVTGLLAERGLRCVGVTKDVCGEPRIARVFAENGVAAIADSRIENLMRNTELPCEKWLIRIPQPSDAERVVTYADVSLNSETSTIQALDSACERLGRTHKVVLMYDLGDLREGFVSRDELMACAEECMRLERVQLAGVGANLNCLSFIQPDTPKLEELCSVADELRQRYGLADLYVSGGNSATIDLMLTEGLPAGVTDLRLGEGLLFGRERARYQYLDGTHNDAFIIEAEVVEAKRKPSAPWGTAGPDSYGVIHTFEDCGEQVRAILAVGNQDIDTEVMWPVDERIRIIAASSDHTILDVTAAAEAYPVGSIVQLRCGYHAALHAFTSPYIEKAWA